VKFYTEAGQDQSNRLHREILAMTDEQLERTHDFIQWLFPTATPSAFNPDAPLLDRGTIKTLTGNSTFRTRFSLTLKRMLEFWNLDYAGTGHNITLRPITEWQTWMVYDNHNLLRMTRFMESCALLGYEKTGRSLCAALIQTVKTQPEWYFIELENVYHWYFSAYGLSHEAPRGNLRTPIGTYLTQSESVPMIPLVQR
jgi:hypothetical protein